MAPLIYCVTSASLNLVVLGIENLAYMPRNVVLPVYNHGYLPASKGGRRSYAHVSFSKIPTQRHLRFGIGADSADSASIFRDPFSID